MTAGQIIFAVMVAVQGLLFLVGLGYFIVFIKCIKEKSDKSLFIALMLWGISPLLSIVGVFFGVYL